MQPVLLWMEWSDERQACQQVVAEHGQELAVRTFGGFASFLRAILHTSTTTNATTTTGSGVVEYGIVQDEDATVLCLKTHAMVVLLTALVLPASVIYVLEKQMWKTFTKADPKTLCWQGGPTAQRIANVQVKVRRQMKRHHEQHYMMYFDGGSRVIAIAFVLAAVVWQLIDKSEFVLNHLLL